MSPYGAVFFALLCGAVAIGRFLIPGHGLSWAGTYEALAHLWVGAMLAWCFDCSHRKDPFDEEVRHDQRVMAAGAVIGLTLLEIVMFAVQVGL